MIDQSKFHSDAHAEEIENFDTAFRNWNERVESQFTTENGQIRESANSCQTLWEAMWRAADFSWNGLKHTALHRKNPSEAEKLKRFRARLNFPINLENSQAGRKPQRIGSLQDYWRWSIGVPGFEDTNRLLSDTELLSAGLLTNIDGVLWHVLHRPETDAYIHDGLIHTLLARLDAATQTTSHDSEGRVLLTGARAKRVDQVLRDFVTNRRQSKVPVVHISAALSHFADSLSLEDIQFGIRADFSNCLFSHTVSFKASYFDGEATFSGAQFQSNTIFSGTRFGEEANFEKTYFESSVKFRSAKFGDYASFESSRFCNPAHFSRTSFENYTTFNRVIFLRHASFEYSKFNSRASFRGAYFESGKFNNSQIGDNSQFEGVKFGAKSKFDDAQIGHNAAFTGAVFQVGCSFSGASFGRKAKFERGEFGERCSFDNTSFDRSAQFRGAVFGNGLRFEKSLLSDSTDFSNSLFGNNVSFNRSKFGSYTKFLRAEFGKHAGFHQTKFGPQARFEKSTFGDSATFTKSRFEDGADFRQVEFRARAVFRSSSFGNFAKFLHAQFSDLVTFDFAEFGNNTNFGAANFGFGPSFCKAQFGKMCSFKQAHFGDNAKFSHARFGFGMLFDTAQFDGKSYFDGAYFKGGANWRAAEFKNFVSFVNVKWGLDDNGNSVHSNFGGMFEAARFRDVADFQTDSFFAAFAAFDNASFESVLILTNVEDLNEPFSQFSAASETVDFAIAADVRRILQNDADKRQRNEVHRASSNLRWSQLSGGFRVVKKAMEAQGDVDRAQTYHRFEVQARLRRPKTTMPEYVAARFYGLFSDYGASIARPLIGLAIFVVLFTGAFLGIAIATDEAQVGLPNNFELTAQFPFIQTSPVARDTWQALEFSLNNAFRPLSALATRPPADGETTRLAGELLFDQSGGWENLVRVLAIIQSLLSFILAFLFGLAVRRKFQIGS